ncbi:MAG TPA: peptidylprolyl isomerase [Caldimonas sp.]|jgi:peptidyl-prolyl cis-trans isomerase SurA|nr:peptidylprolyl isomerase [Caldimonas sp.]HEX4236127.1 peptidylprolyl isomerase [Caldimonas sp.]
MTDLDFLCRRAVVAAAIGLAAITAAAQRGDYIVAVVNQELVTASELQQRLARIREEATRNHTQLPPAPALRKQVLDSLIDERVLVTNARESGARVEDPELDRAVANVAQQNQMTTAQLRERLRQEGIGYAKFRDNLRDQILVERVREREVVSRIKISDAEIDDLIEKRRIAANAGSEIQLAQILVTVPEGAPDGVVAERRARAEAALKRVQGGEDFGVVAREVSEDSNRAQGGDLGMRPIDRLPDLFAQAAQRMKPGDVMPELLRSGAGFHVLKLVDRKGTAAFTIDQSRVRHILLRPSPELTPEAAARRLLQFKRDIVAGTKTFEQLARENSEDGSAAQGGDLGWATPGSFVPEFEEAIAALPVGGISDPVTTRFGLHLVQVVDRRKVTIDSRQLREQARNILREQKFEAAFNEWLRDLRGRSYIEYRDPPQ